jgi:hypothetical protein
VLAQSLEEVSEEEGSNRPTPQNVGNLYHLKKRYIQEGGPG